MSDLLQHVPALLKRRGQWPGSDAVVGDDDERTSLPDSDVTLQARPELPQSSPAGYNPYWDLPPA